MHGRCCWIPYCCLPKEPLKLIESMALLTSGLQPSLELIKHRGEFRVGCIPPSMNLGVTRSHRRRWSRPPAIAGFAASPDLVALPHSVRQSACRLSGLAHNMGQPFGPIGPYPLANWVYILVDLSWASSTARGPDWDGPGFSGPV